MTEVAVTNPWRHHLTRLAAAAVSAIAAATIVVATTVASPGRVTVTVRPATVAAGGTLTGTGTGFSPEGAAVQIHFDSTAGPSMWSGRASEVGSISFSFAVPSVAPGKHVVVATQTGSDGDPVPGTPVSVPIQVTPPPAPSASATAAPPPPPSPANQGVSPSAAPPVQLSPAIANPGAAPTSAPTALPAPTRAPSTPPPTAAPSLTPAAGVPPVSPPSSQSRPPQVLSLWRIGGSVPQVAPTSAPATTAAPQPPVPLMVLDGSAMGAAVVVIALALKPQRPPQRRSKRSHDPLATLVTRW
ncbi:MAG: hypothetical protein ACREN2_00760 [Candidatus Dormibacteria bacterium]